MTPATLTQSGSASVATRRRRAARGGACDEPARLFGDEPVAAAPAASVAAPSTVVADPGPVVTATLADLVADAWSGLAAGAGAVPCLACGAEMQPRWSAGSGVVGGRCDGCDTTLE